LGVKLLISKVLSLQVVLNKVSSKTALFRFPSVKVVPEEICAEAGRVRLTS